MEAFTSQRESPSKPIATTSHKTKQQAGLAALVFAANSSGSITNSNVSDNSAPTNGGGIFVQSGSTVTFSNGNVDQNSALWGGGFYSNGNLTVSNAQINNNSAINGGGGFNINGGTLNLSNASVDDNTVPTGVGGGMNIAGGTVTISNISFNGNAAFDGGAIANAALADVHQWVHHKQRCAGWRRHH